MCEVCAMLFSELKKKEKSWEEKEVEYQKQISSITRSNKELKTQINKLTEELAEKNRYEKLFINQNLAIAEYETKLLNEHRINVQLTKDLNNLKENVLYTIKVY